ncbi:hypothetical protein BKA62DRAFT_705566, partial [Auriculariales sp. MPI-PUGE-AT-0066]
MPSRSYLPVGCFLAVSLLFVVYGRLRIDTRPSPPSSKQMATPATGWHQRATAGTLFEPTAEALQFSVVQSTPVNPEGFTLALFAPDRAIDAQGRALTLDKADFDTLVSAASDVATLPPTFQWRVASPITSRPLDYITTAIGGEQKTTTVYNWNQNTRALERRLKATQNFLKQFRTSFSLPRRELKMGALLEVPSQSWSGRRKKSSTWKCNL